MVKVLVASSCEKCNHNLAEVDSKLISTKQVFNIPQIQIEVTEFQQYSKTCPCCSGINKPDYSEFLKSYVKYGDNITTLIAYLNTYQMLPYDRISEFLEDFISHKISNGTIYIMLHNFDKQLAPFENNVKDLLLKSNVINLDEN
jgi:transposase